MNKIIILAVIGLLGQSSLALASQNYIREFQTSRLNSTAGAGVASILSTEAAILNPASSTFFQGNSASYQGNTASLRDENSLRDSLPDQFPKNNRSQGIFLADHDGELKGGMAYITQKENSFERLRTVLHGAAALGEGTSLGVTYNYIQDTMPRRFSDRHLVHHQLSMGMTHVADQDTILGIMITDPTRTTPGEERLIGGFQYTITNRFTLIGDVGVQYTQAFSKKYLWRGALQLNIFSDFFFRIGQFYDNVTEFKGTGYGVAWMGPRFGVEFSQKVSEQFGSEGYIYRDETIVDTSLSALLKF